MAEKKIMKEIADNGPAYGSLKASSLLQKHKGWGIHPETDSVGAKPSHAITVVGYGEDSGKKYWIIQNSWGSQWGHHGMARIARGVDALGMESGGIVAVTPKVPDHCSSAPECKNFASYDKNCKCHCLKGFSGDECNTCDRDCSTGNLAGKSKVVNGQCQCECKVGFYTFGPTECGTKITLAGTTDKDYTPPGKMVSLTLDNADKAEGIISGDVYVAVPHGESAYSSDGWNPQGARSYVCGEPGQTSYCGNMEALAPGYSRRYSIFKDMKAGHYDVYLYKYLGKNEFGLDKGFQMAAKLAQRIYIDDCFDSQGGNCATYVTWGCGVRTSIGKVSDICAKSCGTCTAKAAPKVQDDHDDEHEDDHDEDHEESPSPPPASNPPPPAPAPPPPAPEQADTPQNDEEIARVMAVKLADLHKKGAAKASECSGWSPTEGKWKGKGASCKKWGWSEPWCYVVAEDKDKPYTATSEVYDNVYFAPCEDKKDKGSECVYPPKKNAQCKSWCATHPQTQGTEGCRFLQCDGCPVCCTGCYDKYAGNCPSWVGAYGCETVLNINGQQGALSTFCRKSCHTCPV